MSNKNTNTGIVRIRPYIGKAKAMFEEGYTCEEVAKMLDLNVTMIQTWKELFDMNKT